MKATVPIPKIPKNTSPVTINWQWQGGGKWQQHLYQQAEVEVLAASVPCM